MPSYFNSNPTQNKKNSSSEEDPLLQIAYTVLLGAALISYHFISHEAESRKYEREAISSRIERSVVTKEPVKVLGE